MSAGRGPRAEAGGPRAVGEGGAALVEFALLAPVLIMLAMGVMEFGLAWHDSQQAERAVQSAGRTGSNLADDRFADYEILKALQGGLSNLDSGELDRVIVYRSTAADGAVPQACLDVSVAVPMAAHGVDDLCNVYSAQQVGTEAPVGFPAGSIENPTCAGGSWDIFWCPVDRQRDPEGDHDYVGVWISVDYGYVTGLLPGDGISLDRRAVFQLEPPTE